MAVRIKATGKVLIGTFETIPGCAFVSGLNEDGSPRYAGETEMYWDDQVTVTQGDKMVWLDEDGDQHALSADEIENVEDEHA